MKWMILLLLLSARNTVTLAQPRDPDSLHRARVLAEVLNYAVRHEHHPFHFRQDDPLPDDSSESITADLRYGHLFSINFYHLIITLNYGMSAEVNVYRFKNGRFRRLISDDQDMEHLGNTIRDVNGDGQKDFLTHWYPMSGCCRRNVYFVYLYMPRSGAFTKAYYFMNPTFSPAEKVIRGVLYGQPGNTPVYKYRWNGLRVDTVEYIYPVHQGGVAYRKTLQDTFDIPGPKDGVPLKAMPAEYRHIDDYAWFLGKIP